MGTSLDPGRQSTDHLLVSHPYVDPRCLATRRKVIGIAYPRNLPRRYRPHWSRPWQPYARRSTGFRRWLDAHGYLSPHFTKAEARCKDGTPVPRHLLKRCRDHAFQLERLRKRLGGVPMAITSWFRTQRHNDAVGGARGSKHMEAIATDHPVQYVRRIGTARFDREANRVFARGGFGQYPGGARHCDTRGYRSRWTSFTRRVFGAQPEVLEGDPPDDDGRTTLGTDLDEWEGGS